MPNTTFPPRSLQGWIARGAADEAGVTAIEYGLLAALIAVAAIAAFSASGQSLSAVFTYWTQAVTSAL
jgi:pilus assembly protein Flp/PilA